MNKTGFYWLPGLTADTGIIRWPINFPPSSKAAILSEARVGRITCRRTALWAHFLSDRTTSCFSPPLTFLKMMGSSSHTGLMALLFWEVLVLSAFLLVSAGSPNISTSTYTPTRRSVTNWPEITCERRRAVKNRREEGKAQEKAVLPSQRECWPRCRPQCFRWRGRSVCPASSWTQASVCSRCVRCTQTRRGWAAWTNLEHKTLTFRETEKEEERRWKTLIVSYHTGHFTICRDHLPMVW